MSLEFLKELVVENESKIVLLVIDGLGGLPSPKSGLTELETASTPNMDALASRSQCGMLEPIGPGITSGSGPAHLALFGYDPVEYNIGRGVLSAMGIGLELSPRDLACRVNFATMEDGIITDRRAGRIPTEECARLCKLLETIEIPGVEITIRPEMQHRAVLVFRGDDLSPELSDSDPQKEGKSPLKVEPLSPAAEKSAAVLNKYIERVREVLKNERPANMILVRGFDKLPKIIGFREAYKLKAAAIATYPMYKGLGRLAGMDVLDTGKTLADEIVTLERHFKGYDFFFVHVKSADSAGEDGDFERKVKVIEEVDRYIPAILELKPDVLVITGDHSTPALLKSHSWHPVPVLLNSKWGRRDTWITGFGERECAKGSMGILRSKDLMGLMLASALRLKKFGA